MTHPTDGSREPVDQSPRALDVLRREHDAEFGPGIMLIEPADWIVRAMLAFSQPQEGENTGREDMAAVLSAARQKREVHTIGEGYYAYAKVEQLPLMLREQIEDALFFECAPHVTIDAWNIARMAADELEARLSTPTTGRERVSIPERVVRWPGLLDAIDNAQRADQTIVVYVHPDCSWDVFNAHTSADMLQRLRPTPASAQSGDALNRLLEADRQERDDIAYYGGPSSAHYHPAQDALLAHVRALATQPTLTGDGDIVGDAQAEGQR